MTKKKFKFPFRTILTILTLILVGVVLYQNWPDIVESVKNLQSANIFVLLLLIPEQLFMFYACGQIFFSYLRKRPGIHLPSRFERFKISTELNFINRAVPAGGIGGLAYLTFRLRPFGISTGQSSFLYIFRYAVTTVINYLQALIAVVVLAIMNCIPESAVWILWASVLMNVGVFLGLSLIIFIASSKKRIDFFVKLVVRVGNFFTKIFTFGKHPIKSDKISRYFLDIHESVKIAIKDKKRLKQPIIWGIIYSFCEIAVYWIVAIAFGHPELLPFIMIGEAIGSVFDGIVPYGLYELGMTGVMVALGVDIGVATIVTVMARVISLIFAIVAGFWPYRQAIMKIGKEDVRNP